MAKIIIMKGLPSSGKSTKAKEIVEASGNCVRLNKDLLRTMLHFDKFNFTNEKQTWNAEVALDIFYLTEGTNVIIDDTNLNPKTLQRWKDLGKQLDVKIEYHCLDISVEECIKRDSEREKRVGKNVIEKMALQYMDYMLNEKVVVCDLDGTLCDLKHRLHYVKVPEGEKKDWKSFFNHIMGDSLRFDILKQVQSALEENKATLVLVSARPNDYRAFTLDWLENKLGYKFEGILLMRESGDSRPDTEVKSEIYEKYLKNLNIVKIFDDRPSVIRMWREKGLEVIDCGTGEEF